MLARIAHELFWLGRNVSRAELTARMIDGVFQADLQGRPDDPAGVTLSWEAVLAIMGAAGGADAAVLADAATAAVAVPSSTRHAVTPANIVRVSEARRGEFICANLPAGRAHWATARGRCA